MAFARPLDSRFADLSDFPYSPHYVNFNGFRMAFIDEQTADYCKQTSPVFLCLHGVPTYSYLYRKIIPVLLRSNDSHHKGVRVICPDVIGFGRSDKPTANNASIHSLRFHRSSVVQLVSHLKVANLTLIVQDWGMLANAALSTVICREPRTRAQAG